MSKNTLKLYVTADGKVAVRTFDEVGASSSRAADKVEHSSRRERESFIAVEGGARRLHGAVATLAGTVGLAGLGFGLADLVKAGQDWQVQQARLQQSLQNTGNASADAMERVNRATEALGVHGGFAAPQEMQAMSQFIRLTGSVTRALRLNRAATELARGTGIGYGQAQRMLGQVLTGNTGRLQRYLGIIQPVKTAQYALSQAHKTNIFQLALQSKALGKLGPAWLRQQEILHGLTPQMLQHAQLLDRQATAQAVLARIQERYGGATAAFGRTTAGAISNAKNAIDVAMEQLGAKALPLVAKVAGAIASLVTYLSNHHQVLVAFGTALGAIGLAFSVTKIVEGIQAMGAALLAFSGAEEGATIGAIAFGAALRLTIVGLAITALVLLVTHFNEVKAVATTAWRWILTAAQNTWTWIKGNWPLLAGILLAPFTFGVSIIVGLFHGRLLGAVRSVGHAIGSVFSGVWNGILSGVRWVVAHVKQSLDTLGFTGHGILSYVNPVGLVGHLLGHHTGGIVPHMAGGGILGGFGGGDRVPAMLEPGEGIVRKESVQRIGVQNFNAINATGQIAGPAAPDTVYVAAPIRTYLGSRIVAEETVHFAATRAALA